MRINRKQMVDFIMSQPPEREVNFSEINKTDKCGCVMVQYGRFAGLDFSSCALMSWFSDDCRNPRPAILIGCSYSDFIPPRSGRPVFTYKEIQQLMKEKGWANGEMRVFCDGNTSHTTGTTIGGIIDWRLEEPK